MHSEFSWSVSEIDLVNGIISIGLIDWFMASCFIKANEKCDKNITCLLSQVEKIYIKIYIIFWDKFFTRFEKYWRSYIGNFKLPSFVVPPHPSTISSCLAIRQLIARVWSGYFRIIFFLWYNLNFCLYSKQLQWHQYPRVLVLLGTNTTLPYSWKKDKQNY